jgi:class 3 adenylate cyclase
MTNLRATVVMKTDLGICDQFGGVIRIIIGDTYILTFPAAHLALAGVAKLCEEWERFRREKLVACVLAVGIHEGEVRLFRSFMYGDDINIASTLQNLTRIFPPDTSRVFVSEAVIAKLASLEWESRLRQIEVPPDKARGVSVYELLPVNST